MTATNDTLLVKPVAASVATVRPMFQLLDVDPSSPDRARWPDPYPHHKLGEEPPCTRFPT